MRTNTNRGGKGTIELPKLKRIRTEAGLSMRDVADLCGVAPSTITHLENPNGEGTYKKARASTAMRLAAALGASVSDLAGRDVTTEELTPRRAPGRRTSASAPPRRNDGTGVIRMFSRPDVPMETERRSGLLDVPEEIGEAVATIRRHPIELYLAGLAALPKEVRDAREEVAAYYSKNGYPRPEPVPARPGGETDFVASDYVLERP